MSDAETETPSPETLIEEGRPPSPDIVTDWTDDEVERYNELKEQDLREDLVEERARQEEALQQIAAGEKLVRYDTVQLGNLELEVKAWLPGSVEETVMSAWDLTDRDDAQAIRESMETMLTALAEMTTSEDYNREFWRRYYERYGAVGMIEAVETILEPASEYMQEKQEAVDGFREGVERSGPGPRRGTGGDHSG